MCSQALLSTTLTICTTYKLAEIVPDVLVQDELVKLLWPVLQQQGCHTRLDADYRAMAKFAPVDTAGADQFKRGPCPPKA